MRDTYLDWTSLVLVVVGALNWGLVGLGAFMGSDWNVVEMVLGSVPILENLVYLLVGLAALYEIYLASEQT